MEYNREKEFAHMVADGINDMCFNYNAFCQEMKKEHRSLQSDFSRLCIEWMLEIGKEDYQFDARNELAHDVGAKIRKLFNY